MTETNKPSFYPKHILTLSVGQCGTCGRLILHAAPLGEVVAALFPERPEEIAPALLLRALAVVTRHSLVLDCAVCSNRREADNRRVTDGLSLTAMLCESAATDAERLYLTPTYQAAERSWRQQLDKALAASEKAEIANLDSSRCGHHVR